MKIFKDRKSAGKLLADRLKNVDADLVLGIPRGGVVVAKEVAAGMNSLLDIIVTRKIGAPGQEELALGAVDPDGEVIWDRDSKFEINDEINEIRRREKLYRQDKKPLNVKNKTVVLVDDGMATGATTLSAIKYLKRHGAKVILAVPVASQEALEKVKNEAMEVVVLEIPENFQAVGQFYHEFLPVSDEEVIQLLNE